jgi:hypothetical protein
MATKKLTPVTRKPAPVGDIDIDEEVAPAKAKAKTKAKVASATDATESDPSAVYTRTEVLEELKKQTEYLHRVDWKLWMIMNMVRIIGEENGYAFRLHQGLSDMDNIKENE